MIDAYTHLDVTSNDPIADMNARMAQAGIQSAVVVETWKGDNRRWLEKIISTRLPQFRVVPCFRPDEKQRSRELLENRLAIGLRVSTSDLARSEAVVEWLVSSEKWLVPHAEKGIGPLREQLLNLNRRAPKLRVYLPHLGWPRRDKIDDEEWPAAICDLRVISDMVVGISAIADFSREPFPRGDVEGFAARVIGRFGTSSIVASSDYPLFERSLYAQYLHLAQRWVRIADSQWSPRFA